MAPEFPVLHEVDYVSYFTTDIISASIISDILTKRDIQHIIYDEDDIPDDAPQSYFIGDRPIFDNATCIASHIDPNDLVSLENYINQTSYGIEFDKELEDQD